MVLSALVFALVTQSPAIANPGFEDGMSNWSRATYGAQPVVDFDKDVKHGGAQSLRLSSTDPTDTAIAQDVTVEPGRLYRFSAWVKTANLQTNEAPVFGTIVVQEPGAGNLASGVNHGGDTDWTQESLYFIGPSAGKAHLALFMFGWGKGTGTVWFDDARLQALSPDDIPAKITREPVCPGRINPMQYGQFIEYLCDLVPSMWAEKLYDGSFEGLTPYKFVYIKETDFKEKPWYPFGQNDRLQVSHDSSTKISGQTSEHLVLTPGAPCEGGVAQDGLSLNKGVSCRFSTWVRGVKAGTLRVKLFHNEAEYAAASLPVSTEWRKVTATLDPNGADANATISITFTGPGEFWLDNASLMPTDTVGGWRKDVVAALRALKPGIIRVGGSVLDGGGLGAFEWTETIGDPDHRTPFEAWGGLQPTGAGLEEVVQLIRSVGAEPFLCVRYEGKTPQDAADEVQYFNGSADTPMGALRAKNGHPEPYRIKYWEIGNEQWGDAYWKAVPEFAKAMRAADPDLKLFTNSPSPELIRLAAPYVDYVSPHQYGVNDLAGTRAELDDVRKMIADNAGGKAVKVGVTEWNTTAGDAGPMRASLWDLANALACSRYENLLHRNADLVEVANRSNLTNSFCSGIIQTSRSGMYLTPTYYSQYLYSNLAGTRPLKIESALPADVLPDLSATLSEDGKWLTIFAVNEDTAAVRRVLDLSDFGALNGEGDVWTLTDTKHAGEPNVTNSFIEPRRV
ncbi:MAG TPA: carbohydrate binding domain-containing protein, partial [Fimbriimonadaceae bacterium]|nr:carbohydrate binding domain-containing protein [Fimbriimonadaceae bacterium]